MVLVNKRQDLSAASGDTGHSKIGQPRITESATREKKHRNRPVYCTDLCKDLLS
jgi:hypothetical protein